jgi:hypothetical protein
LDLFLGDVRENDDGQRCNVIEVDLSVGGDGTLCQSSCLCVVLSVLGDLRRTHKPRGVGRCRCGCIQKGLRCRIEISKVNPRNICPNTLRQRPHLTKVRLCQDQHAQVGAKLRARPLCRFDCLVIPLGIPKRTNKQMRRVLHAGSDRKHPAQQLDCPLRVLLRQCRSALNQELLGLATTALSGIVPAPPLLIT